MRSFLQSNYFTLIVLDLPVRGTAYLVEQMLSLAFDPHYICPHRDSNLGPNHAKYQLRDITQWIRPLLYHGWLDAQFLILKICW